MLGVDKQGEEYYQITLGAFAYDEVVDAVETIVDTYVDRRENGERFLDTYRRVGMKPFKEALYGTA